MFCSSFVTLFLNVKLPVTTLEFFKINIVYLTNLGPCTVNVAITVTLYMGTIQINDTIHSERLAISNMLIAKSRMGAAPIFSIAI